MRITSKGQVTIPQSIRERCGLLPHTEVGFVEEGGGVQRLRKSRLRSRLSTDELLALPRGGEP
jgi:AbrB family looped-hinge helix DNA binding protein